MKYYVLVMRIIFYALHSLIFVEKFYYGNIRSALKQGNNTMIFRIGVSL
jgi:hypothetical protein